MAHADRVRALKAEGRRQDAAAPGRAAKAIEPGRARGEAVSTAAKARRPALPVQAGRRGR